MKIYLRQAFFTLLFALATSFVFGQGATTSAFNGKVLDGKNGTLPGATVQFTHVPTGTKYSTISNANGGYYIPNVKPGGPYTVVISFVGFNDFTKDDIQAPLGENVELNATLSDKNVKLDEVVISGYNTKLFNSNRTGASTNVTSKEINNMPTITRSLNDFTRLSPQVAVIGSGISVAGTNNRYNNFQIDGTVNNDVFGLAATGTNGGQAGINPISIDAIDQIQVVVAPYDVRQGGFTGGGINVITKSGTNQIHGSVYGVGNNQDLVGRYSRNVGGYNAVNTYKDGVVGLTLGGPIIKDKVFLFVNGELTSRSTPSLNNIGEGSQIPDSTANQFYNKVKTMFQPSYNPGGYGPFTNKRTSQKLFARLDYNIGDKNKLTLRYNYVGASDDNLSRGITSLTLNNGGYVFKSYTYGVVAELNTRFNPIYSNELRAGMTLVRDSRDLMGGDAPNIYVSKYNAATNWTYAAGAEISSAANALDQNIFTVSDNFNMFFGNHNVTIGTLDEFYHFRNLFIQNATGSYTYNTFADFMAGKIGRYQYSYADPSLNDPKWAAKFNAMQLSAYAQDEWKIVDNFRLTYGLRIDLPVFPNKPSANAQFDSDTLFSKWNVRTDQMPKSRLLFSPRVGFNWDVNGDKTLQFRGGAGIFTGRVPFVWISNQFSNTGVEVKSIDITNPTFGFVSDPNSQPAPGTAYPTINPVASYTVNVVSKDFKFPQVFRANLAMDKRLPGGVNFSLDAIYSKTINNIRFQNLNIVPSGQSLVGAENSERIVYTQINPKWVTTPSSKTYVNTIYLQNTQKGYTYSITAQATKNFGFGLNSMVAYTYGKSKSTNDGTSSVALSNWRYNEVYSSKNNPELSYSDFDIRHKIIGSLGYTHKWGDVTSTTVNLFYTGNSGLGYSLCYGGTSSADINRDGYSQNDLIYIFTDSDIDNLVANSQIKQLTTKVNGKNVVITPADQAAALKKFLGSNSYTKDRRGKYAERNGARTPWESHFDFHFAQDFFFNIAGHKQTIQLTFDIVNVGNFINNKWGKSYNRGSNGNNFFPITFEGFKSNVAADINKPTYYTPVYSFNPANVEGTAPSIINGQTYTWDDFYSRWRGQVGIRIIF